MQLRPETLALLFCHAGVMMLIVYRKISPLVSNIKN